MAEEVTRLWVAMAIGFCIGMAMLTAFKGAYPKLWHQTMKRIVEWIRGE